MASAELRLNNERAVLTAVATGDGASAAELARRTGLGPQSVARILTDLESTGLVMRGEARRGFRGQPAVPIRINPNGVFGIGCEIGWRHFRIVLRNLAGDVLGEHSRHFDYPHADTIFDEVGSLTKLLVSLVPAEYRDRVIGICIAMPGGIERNADLLGASREEMDKWAKLDVRAAAKAATGLNVHLYNDGNAACWGELVARVPPRPANMAYFLVSTFIAAGLVADGRLWTGPTGNSANLGAMLVSDGTRPPAFVHLVASLYAFSNRMREAGLDIPRGLPETWDWSALESVAGPWLDDAAKALALAIMNTQAVLEFDAAVVDGALPPAVLERLIDGIRVHLGKQPTLTADHPGVIAGTLGARAPAMGAALMPMYRRYFSRDAADMGLQRLP